MPITLYAIVPNFHGSSAPTAQSIDAASAAAKEIFDNDISRDKAAVLSLLRRTQTKHNVVLKMVETNFLDVSEETK